MKVKELKNKLLAMSPLELEARFRETRDDLFRLKFQKGTGHLEDTSKLRQTKKTIARIKTVMSRKQKAKSSG